MSFKTTAAEDAARYIQTGDEKALRACRDKLVQEAFPDPTRNMGPEGRTTVTMTHDVFERLDERIAHLETQRTELQARMSEMVRERQAWRQHRETLRVAVRRVQLAWEQHDLQPGDMWTLLAAMSAANLDEAMRDKP